MGETGPGVVQLLTPLQAAQVLGVSESTLRRWCDAGLIDSSKTSGGHRRIRRQALLSFARDRGLEVVGAARAATAGRGGRLPSRDELVTRLFELLVSGQEREVRQFTLGLLERTGDVAAFCDEVVGPAMHRVGQSWATGELKVFREHAASQLALAAVWAARSQSPPLSESAPVAVCAALAGDPYALAPAMSGLVLEAVGFRVTVLGPDTPCQEVLDAAAELHAVLLAVSVSALPGSIEDLSRLCRTADELGVSCAVGGRALDAHVRRSLSPDFFGDTMQHLSGYALRLSRRLSRSRKQARGRG